jgi:ribosomal protein L11 methyltransferase
VPRDHEDLTVALLWGAGTLGIEVQTGRGDQAVLLAYFEDPDPSVVASVLARLPRSRIEPVPVLELDWVARFRETFRAFRVGRFHIAPPWDAPPDRADILLVDPGRAFGTGTHETTRLCLLALESIAAARPLGRVLDLGAGTGLLALAAGLCGARSVTAVDVDPEAVASARHHADLNHARLAVVRADGGRAFRPASFDLVLANLTAPLLRERGPEIAPLLAAGGTLVLSGLLVEDLRGVRAAYAAFEPFETRVDGDWAALVGRSGGR